VQCTAHGGLSSTPEQSCFSVPAAAAVVAVGAQTAAIFDAAGFAAPNMVLRIYLRVIAQIPQTGSPDAANVDDASQHVGAIAFVHRFGSSLNEHVHFHMCVVDEMFKEVAGHVVVNNESAAPSVIFIRPAGLRRILRVGRRHICVAAPCAPWWAGVSWKVSRPRRCWSTSSAAAQRRLGGCR